MCADIAESAQVGHVTKDREDASEQEAERYTTGDDDVQLKEEQERSEMEHGRAKEEEEFHRGVERQRRIYLEQPALESEARIEAKLTNHNKRLVTDHNTREVTEENTGLVTDHHTGQVGMPTLHDPLEMRSSKVPKVRQKGTDGFGRNRRIDGRLLSPLSKCRRYTSWARKKATGKGVEKTVDSHDRRVRCR